MVVQLCVKLSSQGWLNIFFDIGTPIYKAEVVEFYTNLGFVEWDMATSKVHWVDILFDNVFLKDILHIPSVGMVEYTWLEDIGYRLTSKFTEGRVTVVPRMVYKAEMPPFLKLLFEVMHKGILPRVNVGMRLYFVTWELHMLSILRSLWTGRP